MEAGHRITLADGRSLACLELGVPDGPPVLYFHGYPGSRLEGRLAGDAANRLRLRLLAPDRPGVGGSSYQHRRTLGAWPGDVIQLAEHFGLQRFAIVGASGGGPYALACAARIPERLSGVALLGALGPVTGMRLPPGMVTPNRLVLALARQAPPLARMTVGVAAYLVSRHLERFLSHMIASAPPADREVLAESGYRALIGASMAEALRQGGRGLARELHLLARPWDFSLKEVNIPVQIWQGLDDNIVPPEFAWRLAEALPLSDTHYLSGEGHLSLIVRHIGAVLEALLLWKGEETDVKSDP